MTCETGKHRFETKREAGKRAAEINRENKKTGKKDRLRAYECDRCSGFHLTSMTKRQYKWFTDAHYRGKIREQKFIESGAQHWERILGVDDRIDPKSK